jgi:CO dehydrogenase nickel-insertion accessory protein CooC1
VTLVDFKAGFEDAARGAIVHLDQCLVVVDPTTASIQMAVSMTQMVSDISAGLLPATRHLDDPALVRLANEAYRDARIRDVLVVLNRVRDETMERQLRDRLIEHGIAPIAVLREDRQLATRSLAGLPLEGTELEADIAALVNGLEAAATTAAPDKGAPTQAV